jgi:hypothetical protein
VSARRALISLLLFGISFGYVEAAVVVYLRTIYDPIRARIHPGRDSGELFPLITPRELAAQGPEHTRLLVIELGREAATIIMLAAAALAVGSNVTQWIGAFAVAFGLWDLAFYAGLKVMVDWPASFFTWDILFLLPAPWVGPVIAPCVVAASMVIAGIMTLRRELGGTGICVTSGDWLAITAGGLVIIAAFVWDSPNTTAGNLPNPFNWPLFWAGEAIGIAGFADAFRRSRRVKN